ncbi:hypothetical protein GCG54_00001420 [Colletotrichum gloeosporioides]|uniref:Heterokaryon incompatibility domain-containing protein n=1 Tax=Colletotrichum gloeosporioides TaxID=474922 RepID=A0A8H4C8F6_COLGL|nr:uncharacterized protein GCG54_00001420 [Colletotrichum gloeosporioides]KAF3799378.1 hypothetical protein GCG54_00001420 [Colletotrichum gloeosporioides]
MESSGVQDRYICLSHCWGSKQPLITTQSNLAYHLNHIPWDKIPPLYQDTIRLAWRYGIKYVWIDSLCILQGDERDWAHEAGRMKDVYGNAFLTIAAASSPDCSSGILSKSLDGRASFDESTFLHWEGTTTGGAFKWIIMSFDLLDYNTCYSCDPSFSDLPKSCLPTRCLTPLYTRAWVLQENLLSPRTLSFALYRLKWTCRDSIRSSDNQRNVDHGFPQGFNQLIQGITKSPSEYQGYHWLELIQCYSKLKIAKEHDWLPALSGLAQIYQQTDPDSRYLAGIWDNWLLPSLTWRRADLGNMAKRGTESLLPKSASPEQSVQSHWCTPSWSWASIGGAVVFEGNDQWAKAFVLLRGADCDPSTIHNPWGNVRHGKVDISGPISAFGPNEQHRCELGHETELNFDYDAKDLAGKEIECLVLGLETSSYEKHGRQSNNLESWNRQVSLSIKIFGLLLEPVDVDTATYRRVGLLRYYYEGRGPYAIDKSRRGAWWYQRTTDAFRRDITIV